MLKIFVPAYNEEAVIGDNIKKLYSIISKRFKDFKFYIVDDGSTDKTSDICKSLKLKNLVYLRYKGPSRRENLAQAMVNYSESVDIVCFMDADRSTGEDALSKAVDAIMVDDFDIVIGSRYVSGSNIKRKADRLFISKLFNFFVRFYFNSKINDHECGFKFFKAEIIKVLVKDMGINYQRKMFWDSEMLVRAQRKGFRILEVPVVWVEGKKSALSFKKELSMVWYMLKLKFRL